jgi:phage baseplate assembly protein V
MFTTDLTRLIKNLISIGTVSEIDAKRALAKVNILGRPTNFFPVLSISNSYKRKFTPIKVGEQVLVLCPNGNADFGIIIPSIFNKGSSEPDGSNEDIEITEYEDGTRISYDTKAKELKIDACDKITIICKSANITATQQITVTTPLAKFSDDVEIGNNLKVGNEIDDKLGTLTNHQHAVKDHAVATPR